VSAVGTPIRGPVAYSGDLRRFLVLTRALAIDDFKSRFLGSVLGYLWQLVRPLLLFGILYVVFTQVVKFNAGVKHFPAVLLMGVVLFTFFQDATANAVTSVLDRENLVRKIQFPRLVVPLAVVLTAGFNLLINLVAVLVFVLASGVTPTLDWLWLPLIVLGLAGLAVGAACFLSALYVRYRDLKPIWEVSLQILFYACPILYAIEIVPSETARKLLMVNPLGAVIEQSRHWLIDPSAPAAGTVAGSAWFLLIPGGIAAGVLALGLWVFNREAPRIAEEL
jgi:ABC-2 type transport system permease protein